MDTIEIEPGQAIGTIKIGMCREEVEECIRQYASRYECRDDISFDFSSYFMPEYDSNDRLIALQMTSDVKEHADCLCHGFHVFRTKADDLVEALDKISPYSRTWDASAGFCYLFTEMGLALYRSRVFTEKDLEEEWFLPSRWMLRRMIGGFSILKRSRYANGVIMRDLRSWRNPRTIPYPPSKTLHPGRRAAKN